MQHQFWITKKAVERKLGSKEDKHVILSDVQLDGRIEIFKSISNTTTELAKILNHYQDKISILSQEESVFGRFFKEIGKNSKTTYLSITNTGKIVSYCGQQRMCIRLPLSRLQHDVEIFQNRAIYDTQSTIQTMEKERTEYRAGLSWMKSSSSELDPDTEKSLEKFRTVQSHVRQAKQNFDSLSMTCIQKIDLLAAARCNMYSQALISYLNELKEFAEKTVNCIGVILKVLLQNPKYNFCLLKDLTNEKSDSKTFIDEESFEKKSQEGAQNFEENLLITDLIDKNCENILDLNNESDKSDKDFYEFNSQISTECFSDIFGKNLSESMNEDKKIQNEKLINNTTTQNGNKNSFLDLLSDLDPLANMDAYLKVNNGINVFEQT